MFAQHEPITVPSAIGWAWASAVYVDTASSGAELPYATTISPTTSGLTPSARATAAEPRSSHAAPTYRTSRPMTSSMTSTAIGNARSLPRG